MRKIRKFFLCALVIVQVILTMQPLAVIAKNNIEEKFNQKAKITVERLNAIDSSEYDLTTTTPINRVADKSKVSVFFNDKGKKSVNEKVDISTTKMVSQQVGRQKERVRNYIINTNDFNSTIPEKLNNENRIKISREDTIIELLPMFNDFVQFYASKDTLTYLSDKRSVLYNYFAYNDSFKEEIVLYEPQESYTYYYELTIENGTLALIDQQYFVISSTNKRLFEFRAPVVVDAIGSINEEIGINVYPTDNGYHIEVKVDDAWMNDDDRVYPIIIDPEFKAITQEPDTMIYSEMPNQNYVYDDVLTVGFSNTDEYRPFFKLDNNKIIELIAEGAVLDNATFDLYVLDSTQLEQQEIQLCVLNQAIDPYQANWINSNQIPATCYVVDYTIAQQLTNHEDFFQLLSENPIDDTLTYQIEQGTPLVAINDQQLYYLFDQDDSSYIYSDNGDSLVDQSVIVDLKRFIRPETITITFGGDFDSSKESLLLTFINSNTETSITQLVTNSMSSSNQVESHQMIIQLEPSLLLFDKMKISTVSSQSGGKPRINEIQINNYQLEDNYLQLDISDYLQQLIDQEVDNYGFYLKMSTSTEKRIDFLSNDNSDHQPTMHVSYESTYDVSLLYPLTDITLNVVSDISYVNMKASLESVTFNGVATPGSDVKLYLRELDNADNIVDGEEISNIGTSFIENGNYNYQSFHHFTTDDLKQNGVYQVEVIAEKDGQSSQSVSVVFMIAYLNYFNSLADLAFFYGVEVSVLIADNNITQDLDPQSVIFVRNPKRNIGKSYSSASIDYINETQTTDYMLGTNHYNEYYDERVNINTGNYHLSHQDMQYMMFGEQIKLTRAYNSKNTINLSQLGTNWDYDFNYVLMNYDDDKLVFKKEDGQRIYFKKEGDVYQAQNNDSHKLTKTANEFVIEAKDKKYYFSLSGQIDKVVFNNGYEINYIYDDNERISRIVLQNTDELALTYDDTGLITSISYVATKENKRVIAQTIEYNYDQLGRLVEVIDPLGYVVSYSYDELNRIVSWCDKNANIVDQITYDNQNRVITLVDTNGIPNNFTYYSNKGYTDWYQNNLMIKKVYYDQAFKTEKVIYNDGAQTGKTYYQENGQVNVETLMNNATLTYTYDDNQNIIAITRSDGKTRYFTYDIDNNLLSETDYFGNVTQYSYENNLLVQTDYADGTYEEYTYQNRLLVTHKDQMGNTTSYQYDDKGRRVLTTYADDISEAVQYNLMGYTSRITNNDGYKKVIARNFRNEIVFETTYEGSITQTSYDGNGNVISLTDGNNYTRNFYYDTSNNLVKEIDPYGNYLLNIYDDHGNLIKQDKYDSEDNIIESGTTYLYDQYQRLLQAENLNGSKTEYQYNRNGELERKVDNTITQESLFTIYRYDQFINKVIQEHLPDGNVVTYSYDANGNIIEMVAMDGLRTVYEYDVMNRLKRQVDDFGVETLYTYDLKGNLLSTTKDTTETVYYSNWSDWQLASESGITSNHSIITKTQYRQKEYEEVWVKGYEYLDYLFLDEERELNSTQNWAHTNGLGLQWQLGYAGTVAFDSGEPANFYGYKDYGSLAHCGISTQGTDSGGTYCKKFYYYFLEYKFGGYPLSFSDWQDETIIANERNIIETQFVYSLDGDAYSTVINPSIDDSELIDKEALLKRKYYDTEGFSAWSETVVLPQANRVIETRFLYREKKINSIWSSNVSEPGYIKSSIKQEESQISGYMHTSTMGFNWVNGFMGETTYNSKYVNVYGYKDYEYAKWGSCPLVKNDAGGSYCEKTRFKYVNYKYDSSGEFQEWQEDAIIKTINNIIEVKKEYRYEDHTYSDYLMSANETYPFESENILDEVYLRLRSKMVIPNNSVIMINDEFDIMAGVSAYDALGNDITENITLNVDSIDTTTAGIIEVIYSLDDLQVLRVIEVVSNNESQIDGNWITLEPSSTVVATSANVELVTADDYTQYLISSNEWVTGLQEQPSSVPNSGNYRLITLDPYYRERSKTIEVFNNNQVNDPSYLLIGHLDTLYGQWESRIIDWDACSINTTAPTYGGIDNEIIKYFSSSISGYWTNTFYNNNYYANYSHVRCGYQVRYKYGTNYPNSHVAYMIQEHTRDFSERYEYYHYGSWSNWESGTLVTDDYYDRENQVNYKYIDGVLSEWIPVGIAVPENYYEVQTQTLYTYRVKRTLTALDYVLVNTGDEINLTDYYSYFDPRDGDIDEIATLSLAFLETDLSDEIDDFTFVFNEIGNYQLTVITDEGSKQIEISARESMGSRVTENIYDARNRVIKTIDAENNAYEYYYNSNRLIKLVDPIGTYVVYTYDQDNQITKEEVFDNLDICVSMYSYTYDKMGNRLSVTDIDGYSTYYVYNANNQVKQVKQPMFDLDNELTYAIEQFEYDVSGRVVKHTNPYGLITRNYYDQMGYLTSVTSQLDVTSIIVEKSTAYDINGNITELIDKGVSTTFEYNEFNDLIKKVSASGLNTYYEYDSNHRLIKEIYTENDDLVNVGDNKREVRYQYNNLGQLCLQKDTLGRTKLMFYDQYGNQEAIKDFNGNFEQAQYNNNDQVILKIDARKNYTFMYYDSRGNLKTLVMPNKAITHFGYDALNNQVSIIDALGNTTLYEYNMYNSQTKIVDSKNQVTIMTYTPDQKINKISYQDDDNNEIKRLEYSYDLLGNMIQETIIYTNPLEEMMDYRLNQYVYDAYSQLKTSVNANNNVTNYDYDNNHRLVKTTYPNGLETINIYDSVTGALISTRQVNSNLIGGSQRNTFYEYNVYGEISKQTYANNSFVEMSYSSDGQITSVSYSNSDLQDTSDDHVITYYYDLNGQLITTLDNGGYDQTTDSYQTRVLETRTYNNYGEVVSITNLNGLVTSFDYDQYGRLIKTTEEDVEHSSYENSVFVSQTSDLVTTTTYDLLDRVVSVSEPNGLLTTNVYDELGNVIQVITSADEVNLTTTYTYDRFNNVITTIDSLNQTTSTIYNALNQLVKTIEPTLESTVYEYDDNGNLIKKEYYNADASKSEKTEYVFNNMDQLTQTKEYRTTNGVLTPYLTTNTYTKFGEIASVQDPTGYTILYQYDDMGNKIHADYGDQNEIEYEYDKNNRLIQVIYSTRNLDLYNQFTITETYEYYRDGKLRLYVPNQPTNSSSETKKVYYYYQDDQISSKVTTLSQIINDQEVISAQDTVNYLYDQRGQLTELSDKLGKTLYAYDKSKNLTQITRVDQLVTYDNDHNELTRVDQTSQTVGYSYDSYHNQTAIIYPDNTSVVYEYDELQRLSSVTDQNGTTTYTYDLVDNELIETLPSGEITVTTYQLGKVTRKLTTYFDTQLNQLVTLVDQSITYDETGNVLTDTLIKNGVTATTLNTYDERSQLLSSIKTAGTDKIEYNYVIDPFGNKNEVIKYYSNDILTSSNTKSYTYNHLYQLASATIDSVLVNYVYDPYGNLVSEDNGTTEITYSYDLDNNLIAYDDGTSYQFSYDGSGKRISKQVDSIEIRYVNDASKANEQVLTYTVLNTTFKLTYGLKRLYEDDKAYIYDSYGNVIIHDDEEYAYSPYGSLSEGIIDGFNEYGYKGEVHDNQALQYLRARYYHTKLTQFIAIDTYRGSDSNPLSQNRYSFAGNNPYKYSDPSGHRIVSIIENELGGKIIVPDDDADDDQDTYVNPDPPTNNGYDPDNYNIYYGQPNQIYNDVFGLDNGVYVYITKQPNKPVIINKDIYDYAYFDDLIGSKGFITDRTNRYDNPHDRRIGDVFLYGEQKYDIISNTISIFKVETRRDLGLYNFSSIFTKDSITTSFETDSGEIKGEIFSSVFNGMTETNELSYYDKPFASFELNYGHFDLSVSSYYDPNSLSVGMSINGLVALYEADAKITYNDSTNVGVKGYLGGLGGRFELGLKDGKFIFRVGLVKYVGLEFYIEHKIDENKIDYLKSVFNSSFEYFSKIFEDKSIDYMINDFKQQCPENAQAWDYTIEQYNKLRKNR